jgi:ABC-2 type transport system ATP-binding protein
MPTARARSRTNEVLDLTGLADRAGDQVKEYSGGMKRRLNIGVGLLHQPKLLVLDEPTVGVDPQSRNAILEGVERLSDAGMAVLYTTHYMEEAERLADRVAVVDHGSLVASGTPAELTGTAGQLRFRAESGLDTDSLLAALPPGSAAKESPAGYYVVEVHDRVDPRLVAAVTAWCAEHGVLAQSLQIESRTLEDVFLELTGRELRS